MKELQKNMFKINHLTVIFVFFFIAGKGHSQILWEKLYQEQGATAGRDIIPTFDNGYMITGFCNPSNTLFGQDFLFLKIDSIGDLDWAVNYGMNSMDIAESVIQVHDSGYVACGYGSTQANSSDDIYLVKVDQNGGLVWEKTYGGILGDVARDAAYSQTDSSILIVGSKGNFGWLLKVDKDGDTLWSKTFADTAVFESIIITTDGGYLMTGKTKQSSGIWGYVVKTDSLGIEEWIKYFEGGGSESLLDCKELESNQYIISGYSLQDLNTSLVNGIIRRLDSDGSQIWYKTYGDNRQDYFESSIIRSQDEYVFVGNKSTTSNQQIYLVKTDSYGELIWECQVGDSLPFDESGYAICNAHDSGYIVSGTKSYPNSVSVCVLKIGENGNTAIISELISWNEFEIYPNPFVDNCTISFSSPIKDKAILKLFTSDGRLVFQDHLNKESSSYKLERNSLCLGQYIISIECGNSITTKKISIY
jgi:hypothetical protein